MLKRIKTLFMWIGIILSMLVAWKAYDEYRFVKAHQRAMDLLGEPGKTDAVIDPDGTLRGDGYVIDLRAMDMKAVDPKVMELD